MEELVRIDDVAAVRTLTLNRPDKLNALSTGLVGALSQALTRAADDDGVRVVVIAGSGRSFCAGYDLDEAGPVGAPAIADGLRQSLDRLLEVFDQPQPVIAQVHGHCLAGGCDLMMMCDLAVASDDAVFGQPEIRFGSAVVAHVMPWLIGARRAKELVLTGFDRLDAATALDYGLVNRVVPRDRLREETMALAQQLAVVDPEVMRLTKRAINAAWEASGFRSALRAGVEIGAEIESARSPERVEFERIAGEHGLKEAVRWRDARFGDQTST
jgi:enoyl-CoA hydratase/carnithine racemase